MRSRAMFDELLNLSDDPEEVLAVYFHEQGHSELRHVERSILQNSAWVVFFTLLIGDLSGAGDLVVSLPIALGQSAYSREMEREADLYAVEKLAGQRISPLKMASMLEKLHASDVAKTGDEAVETAQNELEDQDDDHKYGQGLLDYLSSHPAMETRAAYIREASGRIE